MKLLGVIQDITYDGRLVVRGTFAPYPRARIVDNRNKPLGQVRRVFGPVDSPYVLVDPTGKNSLLGTVGKQVYIEEVEQYAKGKRRDRRD
jgi:RNA-binding protein